MERIIEYKIDKIYTNHTIQYFLSEKGYSHHILTHLKRTDNGILLNGVWERTSCLLSEGDILTVHYIEEESSKNIPPVNIPLDIIYEDEDILVVNKPADMPIHPSIGNYENTLANGLAYYFQSKGEAFVFRCINRLDRDTTGLVLVAKHGISACILSNQMMNRLIRRTYFAVVSGYTPACGSICAPIARVDESVIERHVDFVRGDYALTHYFTLNHSSDKKLSLIQLNLDTGRTHQIRVHMKYIGHPLIGDFLYNPDFTCIKRQALHSGKLEFTHPVRKEALSFTCAVPADFPISQTR